MSTTPHPPLQFVAICRDSPRKLRQKFYSPKNSLNAFTLSMFICFIARHHMRFLNSSPESSKQFTSVEPYGQQREGASCLLDAAVLAGGRHRNSYGPLSGAQKVLVQGCGSQSGVPGPAASASPGKWLDTQIPRLRPRPAGSDTWLNKPSR